MTSRANLTDSPWFWLFLFGGMGIVAVIGVGPKHARRQQRLDRMQQARQQLQLDRSVAEGGAETQAAPQELQDPGDESLDDPAGGSGLAPLAAFLAAALALAWLARGSFRLLRRPGEPAA